MRRVFLIVLDSVGAGAAPDAADFGDAGCGTLQRVARSSALNVPTLKRLGLACIEGLSVLQKEPAHTAAVARLREASAGKDTTIGHWEIAGLISPRPLPTYPDGFPADLIDAFSHAVGRGVLCNKPYSGTQVIADYGERHQQTGELIVYTSADSVFQIAAHEQTVPLPELYRVCETARGLLIGKHGVGRVIARPFTGVPGAYTRTANRRDFSLPPPAPTMLDALSQAGREVIAVGKIRDIFAGRGITRALPTHGNAEGMETAAALAEEDFSGLCFVNLVDFDMLYGHRRDVDGYAAALTEFDRWLDGFLPLLTPDDCLMMTADHGCDPGFAGTDHTREYVPWITVGPAVRPVNLGTLPTFADVAATVTGLLGVSYSCAGTDRSRFLLR